MGGKPSLKGNLVQKDPKIMPSLNIVKTSNMQNIDVKIVKFYTFGTF